MAETPTKPRRRRKLLVSCLGLLALGSVASAVYLWAAWSYNYSEGERAGYVQKLSRKGWICKTWEGELAMANLPGAMPEVFPFTVHDDEVAARINDAMGRRVALHYEEHVGLPTSCFGETRHFITEVRIVEP